MDPCWLWNVVPDCATNARRSPDDNRFPYKASVLVMNERTALCTKLTLTIMQYVWKRANYISNPGESRGTTGSHSSPRPTP